MAREFSRKFYDSPAWRKCRKAFISYRKSVDGGLCQICKDDLGYIVDHIEELTPENINNQDITLSWSNFQYVCLVCHNKKTFGEPEEKKYFFGEDGQIYPLPPKNNLDPD